MERMLGGWIRLDDIWDLGCEGVHGWMDGWMILTHTGPRGLRPLCRVCTFIHFPREVLIIYLVLNNFGAP